MKFCKYYFMEECSNQEDLFDLLNDLQESNKIDYEIIKGDSSGDVLMVEDLDLTTQEIKKLMADFTKLDIIKYPDFDYDPYREDFEDDIEDYIDEDEY